MQRCSNCGHTNRAGIVFCENCGASLIGKMPLDTKSLNSSSEEERAELGVDASVLTDVKVQGTTVFEEDASLRLDLEGSPEPILFKPKPETIFGRRDPATGAMPDIDLTPFAGYRMGVSRRHAAIRRNEEQTLDLWDLGSSNGTYLNGTRLSAHRPYRLHDGDELRLGSMVIRISFETPTPQSQIKTAPLETQEVKKPVETFKPAEAKPAPQALEQADAAKPAEVFKPAEPKPAPQAPEPMLPASKRDAETKPAESKVPDPTEPKAPKPDAAPKVVPSAPKPDAETKPAESKVPDPTEPKAPKPDAAAKPAESKVPKQPPKTQQIDDKPDEKKPPATDKLSPDDVQPNNTKRD